MDRIFGWEIIVLFKFNNIVKINAENEYALAFSMVLFEKVSFTLKLPGILSGILQSWISPNLTKWFQRRQINAMSHGFSSNIQFDLYCGNSIFCNEHIFDEKEDTDLIISVYKPLFAYVYFRMH